jgi:hypothetical protein
MVLHHDLAAPVKVRLLMVKLLLENVTVILKVLVSPGLSLPKPSVNAEKLTTGGGGTCGS